MTGRYEVRLFDPVTGLQTAIFDDWNSLYYYLKLDDTSIHTFSMDGMDPRRALFVPDALVEVYRSDLANGLPATLEYGAFHRTDQDQTTDTNDNLFTSYGRDYKDLIHRREVLYFSGSAGDIKVGPADDIMKAYVRENAGSLATVVNGRLRDGVTSGLSVAPDNSLALAWNGTASWKNLLDIVQQIAQHGSIDWDVVRTGATTFQFITYWPRLGTDRTVGNQTIFAPELGNMSLPFSVLSRVEEANDIIVLGPGEGNARTFIEVLDVTPANVSPWNRVERSQDARNSTTTAQMNDVGQTQRNALKATRQISFQVIQSLATVYGRDYRLGDLIIARYKGIQEIKKIVGVEVTVANGREDIRIHFDDEVTAAL